MDVVAIGNPERRWQLHSGKLFPSASSAPDSVLRATGDMGCMCRFLSRTGDREALRAGGIFESSLEGAMRFHQAEWIEVNGTTKVYRNVGGCLAGCPV